MKVAIVGSRECGTIKLDEMNDKIPQDATLIISGGAVGIDQLAEQVAALRGIACRKILPNYGSYGRAAPLVRNQEIVKSADLVLAFWNYSSKGTASTIAYCIEQNVPVQIIGLDDIR